MLIIELKLELRVCGRHLADSHVSQVPMKLNVPLETDPDDSEFEDSDAEDSGLDDAVDDPDLPELICGTYT